METENSRPAKHMVAGRPGLAAPLITWVQRMLHVLFAKMATTGCGRRLKLVETLQLGGKRQLMLVQCDGRLLLVGAGADSIQSIVEMGRQPIASVSSILADNMLSGYERADAIETATQDAVCQ